MFKVKTQDVDGSDTRRFKTRAAATKRFEEMLGYSMTNAIDEMYYATDEDKRPKPETVRRVRGVSSFGTVVVFEEVQS